MRLLFVHGWAFDAGLWDPLRQRLAALLPGVAFEVRDAGYFHRTGDTPDPDVPGTRGTATGARFAPPAQGAEPIIAIGHSLGALTLLAEPPAGTVALVMINGFARFSATDDHPDGIAPRVIDRMLTRLARDPRQVVDDFRLRCGAPPVEHDTLDAARLAAGLVRLRDDDQRAALAACPVPVRLLAGEGDAIAPAALTRATRVADLHWHPGGHLLPTDAPDWCAGHIVDLVRRIAP